MPPSNPVEDKILDPLPSCFLNCLTYVYVHVVYGIPSELEGIKLLLKNAKVLRRLEVMLQLFNPNVENEFPLELLKIPRASKDCGIFMV